jgi:hypothetical protein
MAAWYISREARVSTRYDSEHAMKRTVVALLLVACSYDELPDNPPLTVPGQTVQQPPPGQAPQPMAMPNQPTTFDPALAVPGVQGPITPVPAMPPGMQPGQVPPGMQPGQVPPGMQPGQVPPGMQPGQVPPGGVMQPSSAPPAGALTLAPGFQPPFQRVQGMAAGDIPSDQILGPTCANGLITREPSTVVVLAGQFANLRVLASSRVDAFLAIQGSDGSVRCNDDAVAGNPSPLIEGPFAPGTYRIWVGTYHGARGQTAPSVLGFTEAPGIDHSALFQQ